MNKEKAPPTHRPDDFIYDLEEKLKAMRHIRMDAGHSQQEMADLLGIDQSRIARLESGEWRKSKHIQTFIQLARLLDLWQLEVHAEEED